MKKNGEFSWGRWGTWRAAESYLGKEVDPRVGADEVERGSIRRWLEPKEFDCPLHYEERAAKLAGYKGIIAPCTMVLTYAVEAYWKPGDPPSRPDDRPKQIPLTALDTVPAPCTLSFVTDVEVEFFLPIDLGDRITSTSKLTGITRKELRVGKGAFLTQETNYKNQRGELVAVMYLTTFRFVPNRRKET